jgi:hypothetical protein
VADFQKAKDQREDEERQKDRQVLIDQVNDFGPGQLKKPKRRKHKYTPEFERVWAHWPNPNKKWDSEKAYKKAKKNGLPPDDELIAIINEQMTWDQYTNEGGKYIPHFVVWLNGHRWEDQPRRSPTPTDNNDLPISKMQFANGRELPD